MARIKSEIMMRSVHLFVLPFFLVLLSCGGQEQNEQMRLQLLETDRAFSELSREKGMNHAFETYCDESGVMLRPGQRPVEGKERIVAMLRERDDSGFRLTWEPLYGSVSASGDLGYTYGIYELLEHETGETGQGTYVSIWKMGKGGWKFVLDTGNEGVGP